MGNTTSSSTISQFTFPGRLEEHRVLSKARFLKSHVCHDDSGYYVVKTFVKPPNFVIAPELKLKLERWKKTPTPHLCGFQQIVDNEKTIQGIRQYFHSSLSSRLHSLPFLTAIEKKWITYQLLVYLSKSEAWGGAHGDLKGENVMLTSWNWVFVTDHAEYYKPLYLPEQNSGEFSYYFDTNGRRTCYIAPERFLSGFVDSSTLSATAESSSRDNIGYGESNLSQMDVFSMGCVIAELWLEQDKRLFDYQSLLKYKAGSFFPSANIDSIPDPSIRQLVLQMIHLDPLMRGRASDHLRSAMGNIFPFYFEPLHDAISRILSSEPNDRVRRISSSIDDLHTLFTDKRYSANSMLLFSTSLSPAISDPLKSSVDGSPSSILSYQSFVNSSSGTPSSPPTPVITSSLTDQHLNMQQQVQLSHTRESHTSIQASLTPNFKIQSVQQLRALIGACLNDETVTELFVLLQTQGYVSSLSLASNETEKILDLMVNLNLLYGDKTKQFIALCKATVTLAKIGELIHKYNFDEPLFEHGTTPKVPIRAPHGRSNPIAANIAASPLEFRHLDAQSSLLNATLASEELIQSLLATQNKQSIIASIDEDTYTSEEIAEILMQPMEFGVNTVDDVSLGLSVAEKELRNTLSICFSNLEKLSEEELPSQLNTTEIKHSLEQSSGSTDATDLPLDLSLSKSFAIKNVEIKMMAAFDELSSLYRMRGEFRQAIVFHKAFLGRAKHWKDEDAMIRGCLNLGKTYVEIKAANDAISCYKQALDLAIAARNKKYQSELYLLLAEAHAINNQLQVATECFNLHEKLDKEIMPSGDDIKSVQRKESDSINLSGSSSKFSQVKSLFYSPAKGNISVSSLGSRGTRRGTNAAERGYRYTYDSNAANYVIVPEPGTLGYVIVLDILCAMLPFLTDTTVKLTCLDCFTRIAPFVDDEIRLQRMIPCLISFIHPHVDGNFVVGAMEPSALVRAQAIKALTYIITLVNRYTVDDSRIFQDYLILLLNQIMKNEQEELVKQAFAEALPKIACCAKRCIDFCHHNRHQSTTTLSKSKEQLSTSSSDSTPLVLDRKETTYTKDLAELRKTFHDMITSWLYDASLIVKRTILEDISTLAEFFGPDYTNALLELMSSWLMAGWELKCAIFDNIVGVAQYAGADSIESFILTCIPLYDENEFVLNSAVGCLASLCKAGLFNKQRLRELCVKTAPLLLHPNAWIRFGTANFVINMAKRLTPVEVQCYILSNIRRFLKHDLSRIDESSFIKALKPPVTRALYEKVMTGLSLNSIPEPSSQPLLSVYPTDASKSFTLANQDGEQSLNVASISKPSEVSSKMVLPVTPYQDDGTDFAFSIAISELEIDPNEEEKLFWMKDYIKEARKNRIERRKVAATSEMWPPEYTNLSKTKPVHDVGQYATPSYINAPIIVPPPVETSDELRSAESEVWKQVFRGSNASGTPREAGSNTPNTIGAGAAYNTIGSPISTISSSSGSSLHSGLALAFGEEEAKPDSHARTNDVLHLGAIRNPSRGTSVPNSWVPQGQLIATLAEHEQAVNQIQVSRDGAFFASGSQDGKVKIWDSHQYEQNGPLRSACTYNSLGGSITSISICQDSHSVAAANIRGSIHIVRIDGVLNKESRWNPHTVRVIDQSDGVILKLEHVEQSGESLLIYATDRGQLRTWDLRTKRESWNVTNPPHLGLITSMLVDPSRNWMAVGTDAGNFTCWDMRFRVPLRQWSLPSSDGVNGIYALAADPSNNGSFWASSGPGIIARWSFITEECSRVLRFNPHAGSKQTPINWDSIFVPTPLTSTSCDDFRIVDLQKPLTESAKALDTHLNTVRSMCISPHGNFVISGGADRKLRFWSLDNPTKSHIISGKDTKEDCSYNSWETASKKIFGIEELRHNRESSIQPPSQHQPSTAHGDTILDVKLLELQGKKPMIVSGSRDGAIKVWK